jgi:hypothetical protein
MYTVSLADTDIQSAQGACADVLRVPKAETKQSLMATDVISQAGPSNVYDRIFCCFGTDFLTSQRRLRL